VVAQGRFEFLLHVLLCYLVLVVSTSLVDCLERFIFIMIVVIVILLAAAAAAACLSCMVWYQFMFCICCSKRSVLLSVKGNASLRDNIADVFGPKQVCFFTLLHV